MTAADADLRARLAHLEAKTHALETLNHQLEEATRHKSAFVATISHEILDLSTIAAGRIDLYLEDRSVAAMVREVEAVVQPFVEKNGNTLVVDCAADIGMMHADLPKVRQTLVNLLTNAAKFTQQRTITLTVRRGAAPSPADAGEGSGEGALWRTFAVADTGIGMSEEPGTDAQARS